MNQVLCLGHDISTDKPNGCPKANECQRHVALRARDFPNEATITGAVCATADFPMFVPVQEQS